MDWQTLRNQFMRQIGGEPPGNNLEDELIHAYTQHPEAVERSLEKIALAHKAGKIHSPWGALKTEVAKAVDASRNPTHDKGTSRTKAVQRAEQWIRNAGLHFDRETEILDELFGHRGQLHAHDTPQLRAHIVALWTDLRPLGELIEHESEVAAAKWRDQNPDRRSTGNFDPLPVPKTRVAVPAIPF